MGQDASFLKKFGPPLADTRKRMELLFEGKIKPGGIQQSERNLQITTERITYHDRSLRCRDISEVAETIENQLVNGISLGTKYLFELRDNQGNKIAIGMTSILSPRDPLDLYFRVHSALQKAVYEPIKNQLRDRIQTGEKLKKGQTLVGKEGLEIEMGLIFKKKRFIPWNFVRTDTQKGEFLIWSAENPRVKTGFFLYLWNAILFRELIQEFAGS